MTHDPDDLLSSVERIVMASVALTARALTEVAPELTLLQWRVMVLAGDTKGVKLGDVAAGLGAKMPATSRLIGRLRTRGLIDTRTSEADGRVVLVSLTDEGKALRDKVMECRRDEIRTVLVGFATTNAAVTVTELLADALQAAA